MKSQLKAFTLVELAIVITIIGLLIGGVLKGQELLENARITSLGTSIKSYNAAITTFRDIYKSTPGDSVNASNFIAGCSAANNCVNGDGNGKIDGGGVSTALLEWYWAYDSIESFQAWKHMALANLITGVDVTVPRVAGSYRAGKDVPSSPFGSQVYIKTAGVDTAISRNMFGVVISITNETSGQWSGQLFSPAQALKIDLKLDDGIAFSGDAHAVSSSWVSGCGTTANGTNGYNVNTTGKACDMGFLIAN